MMMNESDRAFLLESQPQHEIVISRPVRSVLRKIDENAARRGGIHQEEYDYQDAIRSRWYVLDKNGDFRSYWDLLVMILALYNCLWTPLTVSFDYAIQLDETSMF